MDDYNIRSLPPPLPDRPLWDGIYSFPFRPANSRVLITLSLSMTLLSLMAFGFHALGDILGGVSADAAVGVGGDMVGAGAQKVLVALVVCTFFLSLYPANCFLVVVLDTGSGGDKVIWGTDAWYEWIAKLFYMAWMAAISAVCAAVIVLPVAAVMPMPRGLWWLFLMAASSWFFPVVVISTMVGGGFWAIFHPQVVARYVLRPWVPLSLYLNTILFAIPCLMLGYWLVVDHVLYLAPLVGVLWAIDWLCYARLVGRAGLVLTEDHLPPPRRKHRRRRAEEVAEIKA